MLDNIIRTEPPSCSKFTRLCKIFEDCLLSFAASRSTNVSDNCLVDCVNSCSTSWTSMLLGLCGDGPSFSDIDLLHLSTISDLLRTVE